MSNLLPNASFGHMIATSVMHSGHDSGYTAISMILGLQNAMKLAMLGIVRISQVSSHGKSQMLSKKSAKATGRVGPKLTWMLVGNILELSMNSALAGSLETGTPLINGMTAAIGKIPSGTKIRARKAMLASASSLEPLALCSAASPSTSNSIAAAKKKTTVIIDSEQVSQPKASQISPKPGKPIPFNPIADSG